MKDSFFISEYMRDTDLPNDGAAAIRRFIETHPHGHWKLALDVAHLDLYPETASEVFINPSNNDRSHVRAAFHIKNQENIEIDGNGASMIVRGTPLAGRGRVKQCYTLVQPFVIDQCKNVVLKNFSLDWKTPFVAEGIITSSKPGKLTAKMTSPQAWWTWNETLYIEGEGWTYPVQRLLAVDAEHGAILPHTGDNFGNGYETNWQYTALDDQTVEIRGRVEKTPPVGAIVLFWLADFDTSGRQSQGIFINESINTIIDSITIHHAWGMGILGQRSENITIKNAKVIPSLGRHFSLTADATHFVSCKGHICIENCTFQNQFDDAVNLHGNFLQVVRPINSYTMRVRIGHPQHEGVKVLAENDSIEWLSSQTLEVLGRAKVTNLVVYNSETMDVTVDTSIPDTLKAGDVLENIDWYPDISVTSCTFRWNRARGILLNGRGKILVEKTFFQNPGSAILFETSPIWCESGRTTDVTIKENTFDTCCTCSMWGETVIQAQPEFEKEDQRIKTFHGVIRIINNTFRNLTTPIVTAAWTSQFIVKNNDLDSNSFQNEPIIIDTHTHIDSDIAYQKRP